MSIQFQPRYLEKLPTTAIPLLTSQINLLKKVSKFNWNLNLSDTILFSCAACYWDGVVRITFLSLTFPT